MSNYTKIREALENISKEAEDIGTPVCNCGAPATGIGLAVNNALAALAELERSPTILSRDYEALAREWKCRKHGIDPELNKDSDFPFTVEEVAAFARSLAPSPKVEGEQTNKTEPDANVHL